MLEGGAKVCETDVSLRLVHSLLRRQFRVGGGFPPPPPARAPPVLLPLLRLTCAGDPGTARPGSRRPARRYSASNWTLAHPSPTCPPLPCLARNFPASLSSIPPPSHIDTSKLKPIGSHSQPWTVTSLNLGFFFSDSHMHTLLPTFSLSGLRHLDGSPSPL